MELVKAENITAPLEGLSRLPLVRQLGFMFGLAASIALIVAVVMWSQKGGYSVLYGGLASQDSAKVVEALQKNGVDYKLNEQTGAIMVPADKLYQARLQLANEGLPKSAGVGFDILEKKQEFGTSQFLENKRYQLALETELARSIATIGTVQRARVHLALPKQSVFVRKRQQPSASVLVNLYPGRVLDNGQVTAIQHLVASSIANLSPDRVTVVDQKGHLLSEKASDTNVARNQEQFGYQRQVENNYVQRVENILAPLVGFDGVRAQVNADLDFTVTEQTQETYNPDLPAVRSKQVSEETTVGPDAGGVPGALSNQPPGEASVPERVQSAQGQTQGQSQAQGQNASAQAASTQTSEKQSGKPTRSRRESTVNYELDRTISHSRIAGGKIKRLSVAVVVDDHVVRGKDGKMARKPWTPQEIDRMTALVKEAIGYNVQRGDTVNVINASFQAPEAAAPLPTPPLWQQPWVWEVGKKLGAGLLVLLFILGVLRPLLRTLASVKPESLPSMAGDEEGMADDQLTLTGSAPGGAARLPSPDQYDEDLNVARQIAKEDPKRVAQVVKTWVRAD